MSKTQTTENLSAVAGAESKKDIILCPSAQPALSGSMILGVVDKDRMGGCISYLERPVQVTDGTVLALTASPVRATAAFRFAAPCEKSGCNNWSGSGCRVAQRLVQILPAVVTELPDCKLRPACRWFRQEGAHACVRCPQVITDDPIFESALRRDVLAESRPPGPSAAST